MTQTTTDATENLLPIANFTDSMQAIALVNKFGDRDLDGLPALDQAALVAILGVFIYSHAINKPCDIYEAAIWAVPEDLDKTSDSMPDALELLDGISEIEAIELIQFLVQ